MVSINIIKYIAISKNPGILYTIFFLFQQSKKGIFFEIEKHIGEPIPDFIKKILKACGYDHQIAFENFNREEIKEIEDFINEQFKEKPEFLLGTVYEQSECFKFLPGHRAILLSLPEIVKKVKESKSQKKLNKKTKVNLLVGNNGDLITEENSVSFDLEILSKKLIEKLNKFLEKISLNTEFHPENISNAKIENNCVKCYVKCPSCLINTPCIYKTYWLVSNIEKHLKSHSISHSILSEQLNENQDQIHNNSNQNAGYEKDENVNPNRLTITTQIDNTNIQVNNEPNTLANTANTRPNIVSIASASSILKSKLAPVTRSVNINSIPVISTNTKLNGQNVHRFPITNSELSQILNGRETLSETENQT